MKQTSIKINSFKAKTVDSARVKLNASWSHFRYAANQQLLLEYITCKTFPDENLDFFKNDSCETNDFLEDNLFGNHHTNVIVKKEEMQNSNYELENS